MKREWKWLRPAVWGFYFVVVLEFLFMISPFALHFYSAYGPTLNILHSTPITAWLTGFYLPHFSVTSSGFVNLLKPLGFLLAQLGLVLFVVGVIQIYGAKLLRRGAVTGGLYRLVRHPQYLALTILGFGVTLVWPRFLVLLSFVAMIFVYYFLAQWEETLCVKRFGRSYQEYQVKTGMIFPRITSEKASREFRAKPSWQRRASTLLLAVAFSLGAASGLRTYSVAHLSSHFTDDVAMLSPARLDSREIQLAYRVARSDLEVDHLLAAESKLLVYVVPANWFLPDLPLHTEQEIRRVGGGHRAPEPESRIYRVLFTHPRLHAEDASGRAILTRAYGHEPIAIIRVDLESESILAREEVPDHVIWGDIPTPLF